MAVAKLAIGMVASREEAEIAVRRIMFCGYARQDISLIMSEGTHRRCLLALEGRRARSDAFGIMVTTSLLLPRLGLVVAGPMAGAIAMLAYGGIGRLADVLINAGVPEPGAHFYETCLLDGGIVLSVYARNESDLETIEMILEDFSGIQLRSGSSGRHAFDSYL